MIPLVRRGCPKVPQRGPDGITPEVLSGPAHKSLRLEHTASSFPIDGPFRCFGTARGYIVNYRLVSFAID